MNRNTIIGIILVVLVGLGIWYYMSDSTMNNAMQGETPTTTANGQVTGETPTNPTTKTPEKPVTAAKDNSFKSIFTQTTSTECKYEQVAGNSRTSSVIYIANGKMRAEFRTIGETSSANLMVYSGGTLYSWKEGATIGKKSTIKTIADLPDAIPLDLTSGASFGTNANNVGWDCHPWATDSKILVPPTAVKFS